MRFILFYSIRMQFFYMCYSCSNLILLFFLWFADILEIILIIRATLAYKEMSIAFKRLEVIIPFLGWVSCIFLHRKFRESHNRNKDQVTATSNNKCGCLTSDYVVYFFNQIFTHILLSFVLLDNNTFTTTPQNVLELAQMCKQFLTYFFHHWATSSDFYLVRSILFLLFVAQRSSATLM